MIKHVKYKKNNKMELKIFISYSWTTPEHEKWVINLAERLMSDGIDVVLDKWDLKEGNDLYSFMEAMVNSDEIHKVLVILDKRYTENANERKGGVGTETQIISPEIYKKVKQEKFIPIVTEKDYDGNAYIPTFLKGKVYIDFSEEERYEESYEVLLRNLYDRPIYSKPKKGKAPNYLFEEKKSTFKTSHILKSFDNIVSKNPKRINFIISEFFESFFEIIKDFKIDYSTNNRIEEGKLIYENINNYTQLRDDYINFTKSILFSGIEFDIEKLINFFENLTSLKSPIEDVGSWYPHHYDNFKFFIHELFIYTIVVGLKYENYKFVEEIFYSSYFTKDRDNYKNEPKTFDTFYGNIESINTYYRQTFSNKTSPMADLIINRIPEPYNKHDIVQADLLCYYISNLNNWRWFPITYIYDTRNNFELFSKLVSNRHFEKIKLLFGVSTLSEFKQKLAKLKELNKGNEYNVRFSNAFEAVKPLYSIIEIEKIGTVR